MRGTDVRGPEDGPVGLVVQQIQVVQDLVEAEGEMSANVFQEAPLRAEVAECCGDVRPQMPLVVRALPLPGCAERLTWIAPGEHVHGFDGGPVDGGDVAQVGDVGVTVGEDPGGAGVDLGVPGDGAADHGWHALLEAAVQ
jgi:hypothetical protein